LNFIAQGCDDSGMCDDSGPCAENELNDMISRFDAHPCLCGNSDMCDSEQITHPAML